MRRPAALATCVLILAGCGGARDAARAPAPAADRAAVQARVAAYLRSYAAGDGARSCAQLTATLRARSDRLAAGNGDGTCAAVLSALGPELVAALPAGERDAFVRTLGDPAGVAVELRGDQALATVAGREARRLLLVRDGGRWLIDDLAVPAP